MFKLKRTRPNTGTGSGSGTVLVTGAQGATGFTGGFSGIISQDLIPDKHLAYSLGSTYFGFDKIYVKDAYISNNTLYVGANCIILYFNVT